MTKDEMIKENVKRLVMEHKLSCDSPDCGISTWLVAELLEKAGYSLDEDDFSVFM